MHVRERIQQAMVRTGTRELSMSDDLVDTHAFASQLLTATLSRKRHHAEKWTLGKIDRGTSAGAVWMPGKHTMLVDKKMPLMLVTDFVPTVEGALGEAHSLEFRAVPRLLCESVSSTSGTSRGCWAQVARRIPPRGGRSGSTIKLRGTLVRHLPAGMRSKLAARTALMEAEVAVVDRTTGFNTGRNVDILAMSLCA